MKCPACDHSCSDLRDICPRCTADLRPEKARLGIRITNPEARYEELVSRKAIGRGFLRFLTRHEQPAPSPRAAVGEKSAGSHQTPPPPKAADIAARDLARSPSPFEPPARPHTEHIVESLSESAGLSNSADPDDMERLFLQAIDDASKARSNIELTLLQLRDFKKEREEMAILFDLAEEAIIDPSREQSYTREIAISDRREVRAETAARQLARLESALSAPALSLKGRGRSTAGARSPGSEIDTKPVVIAAPRALRRKAAAVDMLIVLLLAAICTFSAAWYWAPELRPVLLSPRDLTTLDIVGLLSLFGPLLLSIGYLYPVFSGDQTRGQLLFGLEIVTVRGTKPRPESIIRRGLLLPLALLGELCLPRFRHPHLVHDKLSRTIVRRSLRPKG